jgi:hypothetical protein
LFGLTVTSTTAQATATPTTSRQAPRTNAEFISANLSFFCQLSKIPQQSSEIECHLVNRFIFKILCARILLRFSRPLVHPIAFLKIAQEFGISEYEKEQSLLFLNGALRHNGLLYLKL